MPQSPNISYKKVFGDLLKAKTKSVCSWIGQLQFQLEMVEKKSVNSWYQSKDTIILVVVVTVVTTVVQYISFNTKLWCATDGTEVFK